MKTNRCLTLILTLVLTLALIAPALGGEVQKQLAQESTVAQAVKRGSLKVGLDIFVPWAMQDKKGNLVGFEVDVARELAKDMGLEVELVPTKWDGIIPALLTGKFDVIIVGSGLAGASAAATMGELGYNVQCFTFHDSPRRAHSIAAQGGINAAKNYPNDGDSIYRLFYDTVKGGDFRSRESNVYRLAQLSVNIIDQCTAQGVPFAREYGGLLDNRSFGGAQVSRTFYARGQTGQQLLLGAYSALCKEIANGSVHSFTHHEMLDLVLVAGHGPFTWGKTPEKAVYNSVVLEELAKMALFTLQINPQVGSLPDVLINKHYQRKHGPNAYYGQKN